MTASWSPGPRPASAPRWWPPSASAATTSSPPTGWRPTGIDLVLDITSDDDWAAAVAAVEQRWGGLDVLVNNAGVAGGGRIDRCTIEEWRQITEVNLFGVVRGVQAFTPMLKAQGSGHIVNVASLAGLVHPAGMGSYNAIKAAVVAFTETCGHELAGLRHQGERGLPVVLPDQPDGLDAGQRRPPSARSSRGWSSAPPITADDIAAAVLAGIDAGDDVIVPDEPARQAYVLKWADRPAYDAGDARAGGQAGRPAERDRGRPAPGRSATRTPSTSTRWPRWLRAHADDATGPRRHPGGPPVLRRRLQPDLPAALPDARPDPAPAPAGHQGEGRARHGPRVRHPVGAGAGLPYVAPMVAFCDDPAVLGADFYAMERIDGVIPRSEWPADVPLSPEQARALCLDAIDVLVELHSVDADAAGLAALGKGTATCGGRSRAGRCATATPAPTTSPTTRT